MRKIFKRSVSYLLPLHSLVAVKPIDAGRKKVFASVADCGGRAELCNRRMLIFFNNETDRLMTDTYTKTLKGGDPVIVMETSHSGPHLFA